MRVKYVITVETIVIVAHSILQIEMLKGVAIFRAHQCFSKLTLCFSLFFQANCNGRKKLPTFKVVLRVPSGNTVQFLDSTATYFLMWHICSRNHEPALKMHPLSANLPARNYSKNGVKEKLCRI
jgi:hypothetical protein